MKKKLSMLSLLGAVAILIVGAVILSSCEGPQGPAGTNGTNGADGTDGVDGVDANASCIICHSDDQVIVTKSRQYANSGHNTGHTSGYTNMSYGPDYNCAGCHTSQGFLDVLVGVSNAPYADVTQPNCYTCHSIHDTYTAADWALTNGDPTLPFTNDVYDSPAVDLGSGNQCTQCHQFTSHYLAIDSLWADFDDGGLTTVTLTADEKRAGVHHGPQYNLFVGMDLFEFTGTAYPTVAHPQDEAADGCVTCHMDDGFGDLTGHSMAITYEFHGRENFHWPASCLTCHIPEGDLDLGDVYDEVTLEIQGLLDDLEVLLVDSGVMYPADAPAGNGYLLAPGVFTTDLTAATVNFNAIREDKSRGFHNPKYIRTVLENSIAAVTF